MDEFLGKKYTLVSAENFEEYLQYVGVGYIFRKIAANLKMSQRVVLNEDGTYTFEISSVMFSSSMTFTLGVEFEEVKPDGSKGKAIVTKEGNKFIHVQTDNSGITSTHVSEFYPDKLIMITTASGFDKTVTKIYKLVK